MFIIIHKNLIYINMNHFIHNNIIYEVVDNFEFDNNKTMTTIEEYDKKYYNLPIAMLNKKKIIIKRLNNINIIDFLKETINLHYFSEMKHYKIKFEKLPIIYKAWFLYIQKLFQKFNNVNHSVMEKYNIRINNMINPADFFIIESDDGIPAPNGKKYYLRKHTINIKYNPYDKNTFARKNMIDIFKNSLILFKKNYYRIKI